MKMGSFSFSNARVPLTACLCLFSGAILQPALSEEPVTAEQIFRVWQNRQDKIKTATFEWTNQRTTAAGTMNFPGQGPAALKPLPETDVTNVIKCIVRFDDKRMYYSTEGPLWVPAEGRFIPRLYVSSFDGNQAKAFYGRSAEKHHPLGFVSEDQENQDASGLKVYPILMAYRPLNPDLGAFKVSEWHVRDTNAIADGQACIVLEKASDRRKEAIWVDPKREFSVVRQETHVGGKPADQLTVSYAQDPVWHWVPKTWNVTVIDPRTGKVVRAAVARVTKYDFNRDYSPQDFDFEFPVGTYLTDYRDHSTDYRDHSEYIVLANGGRRLITAAEKVRGATYDDFLRTESGQAGLSRTRSWLRPVILSVLVALAVLFIGALCYRKMSRTRTA